MQPTQITSATLPRTPYAIPERVLRRVVERVTVDPATGCHVSDYSTTPQGYAQAGWQTGTERRMILAHRAAWTHAHGEIPEGMTVDHLCRNKRCINVEHLRLLTNYENARRTSGRDWPLGQCINGHPNFEIGHLSRSQTGCLACRDVRSLRIRKRPLPHVSKGVKILVRRLHDESMPSIQIARELGLLCVSVRAILDEKETATA